MIKTFISGNVFCLFIVFLLICNIDFRLQAEEQKRMAEEARRMVEEAAAEAQRQQEIDEENEKQLKEQQLKEESLKKDENVQHFIK